MISEKQIQGLINSGKSTTAEFKLCTDHLSAPVDETICAFLNREGEQIIIGLDEQNINRLDVRNLIFREIVANMLIHREYSHSFSSKLLLFADRVITENWTKPVQYGDVTIDKWESHTKNPLITKVFREMKWVEELGSGKKNIKKYAPLYYDDYRIEIQNNEKFVFTITYREAQSAELGVGEVGLSRDQVGTKSPTSWEQVTDKSAPSHQQVGTKSENDNQHDNNELREEHQQVGTKSPTSRHQVTNKSAPSRHQVGTKLGLSWDQAGTKSRSYFPIVQRRGQ